MAKLSAAHSAIATRRGVVNMLRFPRPGAELDQQVAGRTREIGLLDMAERARKNAAATATGRHVPIRDRGARCARAAGAARAARRSPPRSRRRWSASSRSAPRSTRSRRRRGAAGLACARSPNCRSASRRCATICATSSPISSRGSPSRCAAEGARAGARAGRAGGRRRDRGRARAADAAARRARCRGQAGAAAAGARHATCRHALGPAPRRLRGDDVPPLAERARSVFLARRASRRCPTRASASPSSPATGSRYAREKGGPARIASAGAGARRAAGVRDRR